jgi:regulatory protein
VASEQADAPDTPLELRARALRLLARREHSRAELRRKLAHHAESGEALDELLEALVAKKQLSDERFAGERAHTLTRRYGAARIRQDLKARGVDDATAATVAAAAAATDYERARAIYERRYRTPAASREERAKRMRFLQGRGFSGDIIRRLVSGDPED